MANTYLTRSKSSPTSDKKGTISFWIKRTNLTNQQATFVSGGGSIDSNIFFENDGTLQVYDYQSGAYQFRYVTNRVFKDSSAWYHIVVRIDTTDATAGDRVKIYINGVQETSFSVETDPSQNLTPLFFTNAYAFWIGAYRGSSGYTDGLYTHFHYTDGYAYDASTFGETDSTSGIWKPKTSPSVTYGSNGFFLKFENSGAMGTDSSGNSNTFTVSGTLTQNVDTPSNNFCTFNGVNPYSGTLSNGNLKMSQASYDYNVQGTLGMESGKYYWEYKIDGLYGEFGVCEQGKAGQSDPQANIGFYFLYNNGNTTGYIWNNATAGSQSTEITIPAFASGMIINLAYDADNKALYIGQNGTWLNSGDPTSGASKTGALITNLYPRFGGTIVPFCGHGTSNTTANYEANFGQGYFGTTQVASAGTAPSEGGIFEYDCPSGYQALCTKGINSF
jgi:hypothetical protein